MIFPCKWNVCACFRTQSYLFVCNRTEGKERERWRRRRKRRKPHAKQIGEAHEKCGDSFTRYNCNDFLGDLSGFHSPFLLWKKHIIGMSTTRRLALCIVSIAMARRTSESGTMYTWLTWVPFATLLLLLLLFAPLLLLLQYYCSGEAFSLPCPILFLLSSAMACVESIPCGIK